MKLKKYNLAIESYEKSLIEYKTQETIKLLQNAKEIKEETDKILNIDPIKSLELKERGNKLFKENNFIEAIKEYNESIKLNPNDPILYSNRAACYIKLKEYQLAIQDCDKSIQIKPDFGN